MLDVVQVAEDEGLLEVEAARDDVLHILVGQPVKYGGGGGGGDKKTVNRKKKIQKIQKNII